MECNNCTTSLYVVWFRFFRGIC